jgi:hypothetical protein
MRCISLSVSKNPNLPRTFVYPDGLSILLWEALVDSLSQKMHYTSPLMVERQKGVHSLLRSRYCATLTLTYLEFINERDGIRSFRWTTRHGCPTNIKRSYVQSSKLSAVTDGADDESESEEEKGDDELLLLCQPLLFCSTKISES